MASFGIAPVSQVFNALVKAEEVFEIALQYSHIEDTHMDKRLFAPSEAVVCQDAFLVSLVHHETWIATMQDNLRQKLRPLLKDLRQCYEYRLLRDWGYGGSTLP